MIHFIYLSVDTNGKEFLRSKIIFLPHLNIWISNKIKNIKVLYLHTTISIGYQKTHLNY